MSNLYKVEHILSSTKFHIFNNKSVIWNKDKDKDNIDITICDENCIKYINNEMYVDMDLYNSLAIELLNKLGQNKIFRIKLLRLDDYNFICINLCDYDIINFIKNVNKYNNTYTYLNINEYTIKKILE